MDHPASCGVCFEDLTTWDVENPLPCPNPNCHFNMCQRCISHLVESSKSDYEMASDGNMHVKVKLQCPSCRGDFSSTIEDVLLLRKALHIHESLQHIPDTELSSSHLQTKYKYTLSWIQDTQERLMKQDPNPLTVQPLFFPHTRIPIDPALFSGLQSIMSMEEQLFVTQFMTSGDCNQVAQAAQILDGIGTVVRRGYRTGRMIPGSNTVSEIRTPLEPWSFPGTREEYNQVASQLEKHYRLHPLPHFMPLFVSMEADFNVYAKHGKLIKFQDDEWDGTIADGFARVMVDGNVLDNSLDEEEDDDEEEEEVRLSDPRNHQDGIVGRSTQSLVVSQEQEPVETVVQPTSHPSRTSHPPGKRRNRVLVRKARSKAAAMGITAGMVVTHLNGEEFYGTADELKQNLYHLFLTGQSFTMVLNADPWTAEALKQRGTFEPE